MRSRWNLLYLALFVTCGLIGVNSYYKAKSYVRPPIGYLLRNQTTYDGKKVSVGGRVVDYKRVVHHGGRPYYTLKVAVGDDAVGVVCLRAPEARIGDRVVAWGTFVRHGDPGYHVFHSAIDASRGGIEMMGN